MHHVSSGDGRFLFFFFFLVSVFFCFQTGSIEMVANERQERAGVKGFVNS